MAVGYPVREKPYYSVNETNLLASNVALAAGGGVKLDGVAIAALILLLFLGFQLIRDRSRAVEQVAVPDPITNSERTKEDSNNPVQPETISEEIIQNPAPVFPSSSAIAYPYDSYWLTQGPHGFAYGHAAIDLAAGNGVAIKSPIFGTITANYVDQYGNTTLIIENERYQVTLLHGNYSATMNQQVNLGEVIGSESNNGYTTDMNGYSCSGRDCGYHTHLNVYDFSLGQNVNPLDVLDS
jgi:murein DD-endopeptidase MepM/ murein hydrolase activator NlpD